MVILGFDRILVFQSALTQIIEMHDVPLSGSPGASASAV